MINVYQQQKQREEAQESEKEDGPSEENREHVVSTFPSRYHMEAEAYRMTAPRNHDPSVHPDLLLGVVVLLASLRPSSTRRRRRHLPFPIYQPTLISF